MPDAVDPVVAAARTRVLAHRGDSRAAPENTIPAFLAAVSEGADGVELDVRRTADGALVVHHDAVVPGAGAIAELRVRDLPASVSLLSAVLDVLDDVVVNVEIKNDPREPGHDPTGALSHAVAALLGEHLGRGEPDRLVVSSFDLRTVEAVRLADARLATGLLVPIESDPAAAVDLAAAHGCGAVHPFVLRVDGPLVSRAHAAGLDVHVWTVNARHDLAAMGALGVDAVITDDVPLALEVLRAPNGAARLPSA